MTSPLERAKMIALPDGEVRSVGWELHPVSREWFFEGLSCWIMLCLKEN